MTGARLGRHSIDRLETCDKRLQLLIKEAAKDSPFDFIVLCGHRGQEEQNAAYISGHSKKPWPMSKHNASPSMAVDVAPWPIDWDNTAAFKILSDHIQVIADRLGIKIRRGCTFSFKDWPHHEMVGK